MPSLSIRDHALSSSSGDCQAALAPQLGITHDGGDWGAQLVGGVGDELAQTLLAFLLSLHRMLDVAQHLVERDSETSQFGPGLEIGHPAK